MAGNGIKIQVSRANLGLSVAPTITAIGQDDFGRAELERHDADHGTGTGRRGERPSGGQRCW